jgi:multiple sugar transport system substrate-binding protein
MPADAHATRPASAERATLTVAAYPALDLILRQMLPVWQDRFPGTDLKIVSRSFGDHHAAITAAFATRKGLPDLMAIEFGYLARFADSGALADLSGLVGPDLDPERQIVRYAAAQSRFRGRLLAIPTDIGPGVTFYRTDLLESAGLREQDLLQSWESFVEAGVAIRRSSGARLIGHARDIKDAILRSGLAAGEGIYFDAQGRSSLLSARFERALRLARAIRTGDLDARVPAWSNDWSEGLRRGRIAAQLTGAWFGGHLAGWLAPATAGRWRSATLPGGAMTSWGGSFFAISAASPRRREAWELLRMLAFDPARQIEAFRRHDAFPALLAAHRDAYFDEPLPFFGGQRARLLWRDIAGAVTPIAVHRLDPLAEEIVNVELDRVLLRAKPVMLALEDAHRMLERRLERSGR